MMNVQKITIWPGCDQRLAKAIETFSEKWGPYSSESRRHSIFSLVRELIDPEWIDLQARFPVINVALMDHAWNCYQWERWRFLAPIEDALESTEQKSKRRLRAFIQCGGKIGGNYYLSEIARHHGFATLERFIYFSNQAKEMYGDISSHEYELTQTLDNLRELASACRAKQPKKKPPDKVKALHIKSTCRLCDQPTERSDTTEDTWPKEDTNLRLRLSSMYCTNHKPKKAFTKVVRAKYLRAKRNQDSFDLELERLDRQSWAGTLTAYANSGNQLVDEFIRQLAVHRRLTYEQQSATRADTLETQLRWEARMMVDRRISDRKKEIVMLLSSGMNQCEVARQLGIRRQAISKALHPDSIPADYRLDILCKPTLEQ